jgi:hypothetical protein
MHVPMWLHLKGANMFITRSFKVVWKHMSLWEQLGGYVCKMWEP